MIYRVNKYYISFTILYTYLTTIYLSILYYTMVYTPTPSSLLYVPFNYLNIFSDLILVSNNTM